MIRGLLFAAMLSAMVGCTLHEPSPVTLPVEPPPGYLESRESGMTNAPTERWWLAFQDEQLNRLMEELFRQNLELTQLIARLDQVPVSR